MTVSIPRETAGDRHFDNEDDISEDAPAREELAELLDQSMVTEGEGEVEIDSPTRNDAKSLFSESQDDRQVSDEVTMSQDHGEDEVDMSSERVPGRRYPSRIRRPREYYGDFISWNKITPNMREKATLTLEKGNPKT